MDIKQETVNGSTVLSLVGKLDTVTSNSLQEKINEILETNLQTVVINFEDLDYLSSSGLRVFIQAQKRLKQGNAELALCGLKPHIKEIFDISGLSHIFSFYPSVSDSLSG